MDNLRLTTWCASNTTWPWPDDGDIDAREWALARAAACREIARRHDALRARDATHHLRRPTDGRPFVIANQPPERLTRGYLRWAQLHLALLGANLLGLAWAWPGRGVWRDGGAPPG